MKAEHIKISYVEHAALAQFYRWFLLYENSSYGLANALDILSPNIVVKSGLGEAHGHGAYAERVLKLPSTWKNSHEVRKIDVQIAQDHIRLDADVTYRNQGILPAGKTREANLHYHTVLKKADGLLPKFEKIEIAQQSETETTHFLDFYAHNRTLSVMHYWFSLIENPARDVELVREVLADPFALNFSSGPISDFAGFQAWLFGPAAQFAFAAHQASGISITALKPNEFQLVFQADWTGLLPDGKRMTAKTQHTWIVVDVPADRFARIQKVDVAILEPFQAI